MFSHHQSLRVGRFFGNTLGQCTTEFNGSALMFPKSSVESVSSSISPITALQCPRCNPLLTSIAHNVTFWCKTESDLHVIASNNVESQHHLFHALTRTENSLVTLVQDQVDGLIKAFQGALKMQNMTRNIISLCFLHYNDSKVSVDSSVMKVGSNLEVHIDIFYSL